MAAVVLMALICRTCATFRVKPVGPSDVLKWHRLVTRRYRYLGCRNRDTVVMDGALMLSSVIR
jgi:hypothetical protein